MLISQDQKRNQQVPHLAFRRGPKVARAGLQCPVAGAATGTRTPTFPSSGRGIGLPRIGRRMVCGVRLERGAAPTLYGEVPTFPTATTVTGARCGTPTQNGEVRMEAGG